MLDMLDVLLSKYHDLDPTDDQILSLASFVPVRTNLLLRTTRVSPDLHNEHDQDNNLIAEVSARI